MVFFALASFVAGASAKKNTNERVWFESSPRPDAPLPPDLVGQLGGIRSATQTDTFVLLDEDFDGNGGAFPAGWTTVDRTDQVDAFWHAADSGELNGGTFGNLLPIGNAGISMWCGVSPSTAVPYCGYSNLPGYGDNWDQILESTLVTGDSISLSYDVFWDSEGNYDGTQVEYTFDGGSAWFTFPITDTLSARALIYDGTSPAGGISEGPFTAGGAAGVSNVGVRFRFVSDGAWSDEDGLWPTDGAIIVDNISLEVWNGGVSSGLDTEDFEAWTPGANGDAGSIWTGVKATAFGNFAALYPGVSVVQEDPCFSVPLFLIGFFEDPIVNPYSCHTPNPLPGQGAMPFGTSEGIYMTNNVWSPPVPNIGVGTQYRLRFLTYRDLPLQNLQFYQWHVREWSDPDGAGPQPMCPATWNDFNFVYFGGQKDWLRYTEEVGSLIDPNAEAIQVAVGAIDMCPVWCNIFGAGTCHSHAPLHDEIRLERIGVTGPQFTVRLLDLFQDNFPRGGDISTYNPYVASSTADADAANDILPASSTGIEPGDSVTVTLNPLGLSGGNPAAWTYVRVINGNDPKSGPGIGSPDTRAGKAGPRWPHTGTFTDANSHVWECFQMDTATTNLGGTLTDRYCIDLNDDLFVAGDTILYFFGADADGTPNNGNESYWHRTVDGQGLGNVTGDIEEAAASPCEFMILPGGGHNRGGDILYVDDTDARGGPAQLFFDSPFELLGIKAEVDRYDVLGPASLVGNSLAARVTSNINQIINVYRTIIWNSGSLSSGTIGDGTGSPEKSNDFGLLRQFVEHSTSLGNAGLYISGDDVAQEWVTLGGTDAIVMRTISTSGITFTLSSGLSGGDHVNFGEAVSPTLTAAAGSNFVHLGVPDVLVAYGGCALVNDFDVLTATGTSTEEFPYPNAGAGVGASAVISNTFTNTGGGQSTVVLSGFSFHYIRDDAVRFPPARVEHLLDILNMMQNSLTPPTTGIPDGDAKLTRNSLDPAYPNPFNPTTTIRYTIKERAHVSLKVYNAAGQLVRTLVDEVQSPDGVQPMTWDGANNAGQTVSSGVYFYRMVTKNFAQTKKMVLLK